MKSTLLILIATLSASPVVLSDTTPPAVAIDAAHDGSVTTAAGQDWFAQQRRISEELEAEHLLATLHQGELSGRALDEVARVLTDPNTKALLASSAYKEAVFQGRVEIQPN
jgi:hypothetical protein